MPFVEYWRHALIAVPPATMPSASPEQAAHGEEEQEQHDQREEREEAEPPWARPDVDVRRSRLGCRDQSSALDEALSHPSIVGADTDRYRAGDEQRSDCHAAEDSIVHDHLLLLS